MRPLVRSYGVISTRTLSPASTRMRFLRMRPAVWAMISCSFSSLTRNVAFGSSSVTTPGNSKSSSFAIHSPALLETEQADCPAPRARKLAESRPSDNCRVRICSFVAPMARREAFPDSSQQLIAHIPIRIHPLLAASLDRGRIRGRPILHLCGECAGQLERLVVRFGRKGDDQVEIQPLQIVELFEGHRPVRLDVDADLLHCGGREGIELAFAHAGRADVERAAEHLLE